MIAGAAIRKDGKVYTGRRHSDIIRDNIEAEVGFGGEQGFVTDSGEFVSRMDAAKIAFECGQIRHHKHQLYSEDLY